MIDPSKIILGTTLDPEVEVGLDLSAKLCPKNLAQLNAYRYTFFNLTSLLDPRTEMPPLICEAIDTINYVSNSAWLISICTCVLTVVCVSSSVLSLMILLSKVCREVSFFYHRAINIADFFYSWFMLSIAIDYLLSNALSGNYAWRQYVCIFGNKIDKALPDFVELLVAWLSVERAACYSPTLFSAVNQRKVAYAVTATALVCTIVANIPYSLVYYPVYVPSNNIYVGFTTAFGDSQRYQSYLTVVNVFAMTRGLVMAVGTVATVLVFFMVTRQKRRLMNSATQNSMTNKNLLQAIKTNQVLCALQLCESLPLIINCALGLFAPESVSTFYVTYIILMPYEQAKLYLSNFRYRYQLVVCKRILSFASHSIHFYLYIIFTQKMRHAAYKMIKNIFGRRYTATHSFTNY